MTKPKESAVLIFDGDCGFCTSGANFILKHTSYELKAEPWQWLELTKYGLTPEKASAKVQLYLQGQLFEGAKAFAKLLRIQKQLWFKILGGILLVPPFSWLANLGYFLVAKYRHRLPGGTPACELKRPIQ